MADQTSVGAHPGRRPDARELVHGAVRQSITGHRQGRPLLPDLSAQELLRHRWSVVLDLALPHTYDAPAVLLGEFGRPTVALGVAMHLGGPKDGIRPGPRLL